MVGWLGLCETLTDDDYAEDADSNEIATGWAGAVAKEEMRQQAARQLARMSRSIPAYVAGKIVQFTYQGQGEPVTNIDTLRVHPRHSIVIAV